MALPDNFLAEPASHDEAAKWIADKPVVAREVFDGLLPELRARSFLITGIEDANVVAEVRAILAELPQGLDWEVAKKQIVEKIGPWLASDEEDDSRKASKARAELLLRTHGFQAYQVAQHRVMRAQEDVFPFWQYLTLDDEKVRPGHAALNGKVAPANSPFWADHSPPWQWGCRCRKAPLLPEEVEDLRKEDDILPPEKRSVLEGSALRMVEQGRIFNAAGQQLDIKSDREKGRLDGFVFDPDALTLPVAQLRSRYDDPTWAEFERKTQATKLDDGRTVWAWLNGAKASKVKNVKGSPLPGAPAVSASLDDALAIAGIADRKKPITVKQAEALIEELKELKPVKVSAKLTAVSGAHSKGFLTKSFIRKQTQEFMNFLPPAVVAQLPPLRIIVADWLAVYGEYNSGTIKLGGLTLRTPQKARQTIFHELTHWLHRELPGTHPWVQEIKAHFEACTANDAVTVLGNYGVTGKTDKWWEVYMGRIYGFAEEATHLGLEFPTRNFELLADANRMAAVWSKSPEAREDIYLALKGLYQ